MISADETAIDYTSCTKSRHDEQWYQKPVAISEFVLHQIFMLLVVVATVYHIKKGKQSGYVWITLLFHLIISLIPLAKWIPCQEMVRNPARFFRKKEFGEIGPNAEGFRINDYLYVWHAFPVDGMDRYWPFIYLRAGSHFSRKTLV